MVYKTKVFGLVKAQEQEVFIFSSPLYGFEKYRRFLLLTDPEMPEVGWLQSTEDPGLCFVLIKAEAVFDVNMTAYRPVLPDFSSLGEEKPDCWVLLTLEEGDLATVNLRTPVLLNPGSRRGMQVVLDERYPLRQPFLGKAG